MAKKIQRVLVTGAAGFVGRHLMDALLDRGFKVRGMDNFMCSSPNAVKEVKSRVDWITGDIRDKRSVARAVRGMDAVFHLAAIRSVVKSVEDPLLSHEVNATGTLHLLQASARESIQHFVFTSTSAVYGDVMPASQDENGPFQPMSPYGMAKLLAEQYAQYFFKNLKLPTTSVRIFNVYGPRQNPESKYSLAVPGIMEKILKHKSPVIDGSGKQSRDFIYIQDVVDAFFKILGNPKAFGRVYNLGQGKTTSVNALVATLLNLSSSNLKPIHGPRRPGDPERTCADIQRIKKELGWIPKVSLEEGLRRTVSWALGKTK